MKSLDVLIKNASEKIVPPPPSNEDIFLIVEDKSCNIHENKLLRKDPYRDNWFVFYTRDDNGLIIPEKEIRMQTREYPGTPKEVEDIVNEFYTEFRKQHPDNIVCVLEVEGLNHLHSLYDRYSIKAEVLKQEKSKLPIQRRADEAYELYKESGYIKKGFRAYNIDEKLKNEIEK